MNRRIILTTAAAAVVSATALASTASTASAGVKVYLSHGGWGHGWGHGYGHGWGHGHYNPCRKWLKKYNWTGKRRYLRKYRRCMRHYY